MSKKQPDRDDPLWGRVKKTVTPLRPGSSRPRDKKAFEAMMRVTPDPDIKRGRPQMPPPVNLDKKTRRGRVEVDVTIDLHDQTRVNAEQTLKRSLIRAYNRNKTCALVITGKGARLDGVLRQALPGWMNDPDIRPIIASYAQAHNRHGGSGAWYVFLKH